MKVDILSRRIVVDCNLAVAFFFKDFNQITLKLGNVFSMPKLTK